MSKKYEKDSKTSFITNQFIPQNELDFHIYPKLDHVEVEKLLNEFLEDNQLIGNKFLLVITGKGKLVRPTVRKILGKHPLVESFKVAGYFNGQDGAFEIIVKD